MKLSLSFSLFIYGNFIYSKCFQCEDDKMDKSAANVEDFFFLPLFMVKMKDLLICVKENDSLMRLSLNEDSLNEWKKGWFWMKGANNSGYKNK